MLFHSQFDLTRQYLISMQRTLLVTATMITTSLLHVFWCHILINLMHLDVLGASLAMFITFTLNFLLLTLFCLSSSSLKPSFFFFSKESFWDIKEYLMIGIPSALMLCLEWSGFEVLIIIAGLISLDISGAQVIVLNTFFVMMMLSLGMQQGAIACVGKAMGEGNAKKGKIYLKLATMGSVIINLLLAFAVSIFKGPLAKLFTTSVPIVSQIQDILNLVSVVLLFTGI